PRLATKCDPNLIVGLVSPPGATARGRRRSKRSVPGMGFEPTRAFAQRRVPCLPWGLCTIFPPVKKRIPIALAVLSTAGICFFTLRPGSVDVTQGWSWYLTAGDAALAELIQNLILFIPLGVALAVAFPRRPFAVVGFGTLLSFSVEFAQ